MSSAVARLRELLARRGGAAQIDALAGDLRALQEQVELLRRHLHALEASYDELRVRQVEDFDAVRASVTAVADDLSVRLAALHRVRAS